MLPLVVTAPATPPSPASPPAIPANGDASCPCIQRTSPPTSRPISADHLWLSTYAYPTDFGEVCRSHDEAMPPFAVSNEPPAWCYQPWCYVDRDNCQFIASKSSYFPDEADMSYSYRTCGGTDTFTGWFSDNAVSSGGHTLTDIIDTVEGYLGDTKSLETNHFELTQQSQTCAMDSSCNCDSCDWGPGEWAPQEVDQYISTITVRNTCAPRPR